MRLKENVDYVLFLEAIKSCSKNVFFQTIEGDCLNLKSVLAQYLFSAISSNTEFMEKSNIVCECQEDYECLKDFISLIEQEENA